MLRSKTFRVAMILCVIAISCFVSFAISDVVLSFNGDGPQAAIKSTEGRPDTTLSGPATRDESDQGSAGEQLVFSRGLQSLDDEYFLNLNRIDPSANSVSSVISPGSDFHPAISPDGTKIVFAAQTGGYSGASVHRNFEIYIMNVDGTNRRRLTFDNFYDGTPTFSPDGTKIIYSTDYFDKDFSGYGVFSMNLDGSNRTLVFNEDSVCGFNRARREQRANRDAELGHIPGDIVFDTPNYSPDGTKIVVGYFGEVSVFDTVSQTCTQIYSSQEISAQARFSPDGTKIALVDRIQVRDPYTGRLVFTKGLRIISANGAEISFQRPESFETTPIWSPDGTKIAYFSKGFSYDSGRWLFNTDQISILDLTDQTVTKVYASANDYFQNGLAWRNVSDAQPEMSLRFAPSSVIGGQSGQGTVRVDASLIPPEGITVNLSIVGDPALATLSQSSVFIPSGQNEAVFQIDAMPSSVFTSVDVLAEFGTRTAQATVNISPGASPSADLRAVSFTAPATISANTLFSMSWTIENIGSVSAFSYDDIVYLSTDDQIDATDTVIQKIRQSTTVPAGGSRVYTSNFLFTTRQAPQGGQYFLIFSTNDSRVTLENGNHSNNSLNRAVEVQVVTPDLVLENVSLPNQAETGTAFNFSYTVRNTGNGNAASTFSNALFLSQDNIRGNSDDVLVESFNIASLAAGQSVTRNSSGTIGTVPARPDGAYFFYLATDNGATILEGGDLRSSGEANNVIFHPTQFAYRVADLQVTASSSAADVDTDVAFPLTWTTTNTGNKATGAFSEQVYFSRDNLVGSDVLLGTFPLATGLAGGASIERIQNVTVPFSAITTTGNYFVYVRTDSGSAINEGVNENNNVRFHPVRVRRTARPNLRVTNITAAATAFFDQTVQVQWTVNNNGAGATNTPNWKDSVYIGTGTTLSGAIKLADSASVSYLNAGESYIATVTVKIPRGLVGSYRFLVNTDSSSQVSEDNETDNLLNKTVTLSAPPLPDLTVSTVQAPAQAFAGQPVQITWQVNNVGTATASGDLNGANVSQYFQSRVYLSQDTTLDGSDRIIFSGSGMNHIPAGGNASGSTLIYDSDGNYYVSLPNNISGNWYVFVLADHTNVVYEFNSENNNSARDTVQPGSPMSILITPPDLVIQNQPTVPPTASGGQYIPVAFTVKNQGAFATTNAWRDAIYLSTDQTFDTNDSLLGTTTRNALGAGEQYLAQMTVRIPDCLNGTFYLIAVADYDARLAEFDPNFNAETNNTSPVSQIQIATIPPDLQITNFQISPPMTTAGQSVSLSWTVTNSGGGAANGAWTDRAFLYSNTGLDPVRLASVQRQGTLAAGASYTQTASAVLPSHYQGDSYIKFMTDVNGDVAECGTSENNNSVDSSPTAVAPVLADLVIDAVNSPSMAVVGEQFNVQWTGRNSGQPLSNGAQIGWRDTVYLSSDQILSNNDRVIGSAVKQTNLLAGQTYQNQSPASSGNVAPGNYYLLVKADSGNNIYEGLSNSAPEFNNVSAAIPISFTAPGIDLQAAMNGVQTPTYSGAAMNFTWTVTNTGITATIGSNWNDYIYLSRDSVLDTTDTQLGFYPRAGVLPAGQNYQVTRPLYIPSGLTGEYFVFVVTDKTNQIVENNDANNASPALAVTLQLAPPADLNVTSVTAPSTVTLGDLNTTISWTAQNSGPNSIAGQWRDSIYLSRDALWDSSDYLVGQKDTQQTLAVGGNYTETITTTIPPVEEGAYFVIIRTDARNNVRELNEGNNVGVAATQTTVSIQQLVINTPFNTTSLGGNKFFKIDPPDNETMLVSLLGDVGKKNELFTNHGSIVSRADYDFQGVPLSNPQENTVTNTEAGAYYSMAATETIPPTVPATPPQNITVKAEIIPFSVRRVSPENAGNVGYATVIAEGAKFQTGATIKLVAGNGDVLTPLQTRGTLTKIAAVFDLKNKTAGDYDVVVTNPNSQTAMLEDGFEIVNGGGHSLRRSINGPSAIRPQSTGRTRYTFSAINDGLNDAMDVPVVISLPAGVNFELDTGNYFETTSEVLPPGVTPADVPLAQDINGRRVLFFTVPILRSRTSVEINLDIFPPATGDFKIGFFVYPPFREMLAQARDIVVNRGSQGLANRLGDGVLTEEECYAELFRQFAFAILGLFGPADACMGVIVGGASFIADTVSGAALSNMAGNGSYSSSTIIENGANSALGMVTDIAACLAMSAPIPKLISLAYTIKGLMAQLADCLKIPLYGVHRPQSWDPNEKIGPEGFGAEKFIPVARALEYRINFENLPTASAPAQRISITDVLPPTLDLRTVRLKEIGFKQNRVVVPANQSFYQTRIQLGADLNNLQADIVSGVDLVNGQIFWNLTAVDPQTGEQPSDPLVGLLPPNLANADGEGYVTFTVEAKTTFPNRTVVGNNALIVFDSNEPIVTNTTSNLLDSVVPTSAVSALPATTDSSVFSVTWSGSDDTDGSGFKGYDVYYSEDGGPYFPLVHETPETSATFVGKWGKTYRFYSIASDNAGNIEAPPVQPDAIIRVRGGETESDVSPRPEGDDGQIGADDVSQVRLFVGGVETNLQLNEFQRADSAPLVTSGNGVLSVTDVMQARRYAAGLDTKRDAAGPNERVALAPKLIAGKQSAGSIRTIRPVGGARIGNVISVGVEIESQGDETGASFTLQYDTADLSNPTNITLGTGAGTAALTVNTSETSQGKIGILIDKAPNEPFVAGVRRILNLQFTVAASNPATTTIAFGGTPVVQEVSDGAANALTTTFTPAAISLLAPTAAHVSYSGRVVRSNGAGINGAIVSITSTTGNTRYARTNAFGNFRIEDIEVGAIYFVDISAKRYQFERRTIHVVDDISDVVLMPVSEPDLR